MLHRGVLREIDAVIKIDAEVEGLVRGRTQVVRRTVSNPHGIGRGKRNALVETGIVYTWLQSNDSEDRIH